MKLIIEDDHGRTTVVPLVGDEITIGRNQENLVRLGEKNVSRRHGRLFREAGRFYIEDLRSLTGIRVNGEKVKGPRPVEEGDRIRISEYDLRLEPEPGEKSAVGPAEVRKDVVEVPREMRARLVGISGSYRGAVLVLDRSPLRIGSSSENDVVVHHPSVSRRHLRLHLVEGAWKVMDVESRSGVRINGEPGGPIALRHGDVVEIGYMRFAFADAGRELELPREFAPMSAANAHGGRAGKMPVKTVVGLLAILLAGALLLRQPATDDEVEAAQDAKSERTLALRSAQDAIQGHRYVEAQQKLEAARRAGATADELKDADAVQAEARGENLFRDLQSAVAAKKWERAHELTASLGSSHTWYGAQAAPFAQAATAGYVATHLAAAAALAGRDDAACLAEAQLALDADAKSAQAAQLAQECSAPAVRTDGVAPPAPAAARPVPSADDSARKLVAEGNRKLTAQDLPGAVALYEQALVLKPGKGVLATAYRGMGVAFTRQGNVEEGAHYYKLYLPLCSDPAEKAQLQKLLDDYEARRR